MSYLWLILAAGIAGWIASLITRSKNGILMNVILGIIGGFIGSWLFGFFGISIAAGLLGEIIIAAIGAVVLVFVARLFA